MEQTEAGMRREAELYRLSEGLINDGLWDLDWESGELYLSPRCRAIVGFDGETLTGAQWLDMVHPDDKDRVLLEIAATSAPDDRFEVQFRIRHRAGYSLWVQSRGVILPGRAHGGHRIVASLADLTDIKIASEQLLHRASRDKLTGLPNRMMFIDRLRAAGIRCGEDAEYSYAVLYLDIDRFKFVNDSFGREVGDLLIKKVAKRLQVYEGPDDLIARFGGDDYVLFLDDIKELQYVRHVAEGVLNILALPIIINGQKLYPSASIGMAIGTGCGHEPEETLKQAESAMYQAKDQGRARYELYDRDRGTDTGSLLRLDAELRRATEQDELVLYYQPVVEVKSGRILGFEALVRWKHPEQGLLPPGAFIPAAEETGIIVQVGEWVLDQACRQYRKWMDAGFRDFHLAVNCSARQFEQKNLFGTVKKVLQRSDVPAEGLYIEVTESVAMKDSERTARTLAELAGLGVKILLDDFGTGYSSFSYLKQLPADYLKVDRSFVRDVERDKDDAAIVKAIIAMAHSLKLRVIAEGAEEPGQVEFLRQARCDCIQGFCYSKPVPAARATAMLKAGFLRYKGQDP